MARFEYKVLPAPKRGKRVRGVKGEPARFAHALTEVMNLEAAEGWEYVKTETLPMESKSSVFGGIQESFQCLLVFRRALEEESGIVSVTPAATAATAALASASAQAAPDHERAEPPISAPEPEAEAPDSDAETPKDDEDLSFDSDDIDPLKTLVDDHRGKS